MTEIQPLSYRTTRALAVIDRRRRRELEDLAADPALHAAVCGELSQFEEIEEVPPKAPLPAMRGDGVRYRLEPRAVQVSGALGGPSWNAAVATSICSARWTTAMARSGQEHTTRELARRSGRGYLFGVEWLELNIGDESERVLFASEPRTTWAFHGNAILSRLPWKRPALIRLVKDGFWFDPARGERRVGGRMAPLRNLRGRRPGRHLRFGAPRVPQRSRAPSPADGGPSGRRRGVRPGRPRRHRRRPEHDVSGPPPHQPQGPARLPCRRRSCWTRTPKGSWRRYPTSRCSSVSPPGPGSTGGRAIGSGCRPKGLAPTARHRRPSASLTGS